MRIALSVMDQVWENKQANLTICNELVESAVKLRADILVLPEMTLTGFTLNIPDVAEETNASESMKSFSDMASRHNLCVIAGVVLKDRDRFQNCSLAYGRNGELLCRYGKVHPFSPAGEGRYITAGEKLSTFEFEGLKFGLTICYDLRFPLLWQAMADQCECIINIANWPARRIDHWRTLLKARAIENQVYIIGVNRIGLDGNNLEYAESSIAFAPDGSEVNYIASGEGLRVIEIEKGMVKECQDAFPVRNDRRHVLYNEFLKGSVKS